MSNKLIKQSLVMLLLSVLSIAAFAQHGGGGHEGHGPHALDYTKLKTDLALTDAQVTAWQKIDAQYKTKMEALKSSTEETDKRSKMNSLRDAQEVEIKQLLTEAQYSKFAAGRPQRREKL